MRGSSVLTSNGQNEARAYAMLEVPAPRSEPHIDLERVHLSDPRHVATAPSSATRACLGPRNVDQKVWPPPPPPGLELPDGLPADKAQRVRLDPELVARWRAEAKMGQGT